ncbi:MAG: hypothetical protein PHT33_07620 [bacterium]|nr:hypothetical protein [bacterium]
MTAITITQAEADALIGLEKHRIDEQKYDFPFMGGALALSLQSVDRREQFLLDISRGRINLLRGKYQNRARQVVTLVRLDFGGPPHRNPDDKEIPCPHLHVYREGFGDKWAVPIPSKHFSRINDLYGTLEDFMMFCNITKMPYIQRGLFT